MKELIKRYFAPSSPIFSGIWKGASIVFIACIAIKYIAPMFDIALTDARNNILNDIQLLCLSAFIVAKLTINPKIITIDELLKMSISDIINKYIIKKDEEED